jgi:hypothetical protein
MNRPLRFAMIANKQPAYRMRRRIDSVFEAGQGRSRKPLIASANTPKADNLRICLR